MSVLVLEVRRIDDGVWQAEDLPGAVEAVEGLSSRPSQEALVRVGGALRKLTVYLEGDEAGVVAFADAYGASS